MFALVKRGEGHPGANAPAVALVISALLLGTTGCRGDDPAAKPTAATTGSGSQTDEPTDSAPTGAPLADNELILPVDGASTPTANGFSTRSRAVDLNTDLLTTGDAPVEVTLTPFPDLTYTASLTYSDTAVFEQWTGELDGVKKSTVVIVVMEDVYNLHISSPEGLIEAVADGTGSYVVRELDPNAFPSEGHLTPSG